jgi:hypothetical protein
MAVAARVGTSGLLAYVDGTEKNHDAMITAIEHAFGSLTPLLQDYGVVVVMIILMLESIGLPFPGESLLILPSVLAARGDLSFPSLLVFAWAGAVLGDNIGYVLGRTFGRAVVLRFGGRIGFKADRLRQVEDVFARYGPSPTGRPACHLILLAWSLHRSHWLRPPRTARSRAAGSFNGGRAVMQRTSLQPPSFMNGPKPMSALSPFDSQLRTLVGAARRSHSCPGADIV